MNVIGVLYGGVEYGLPQALVLLGFWMGLLLWPLSVVWRTVTARRSAPADLFSEALDDRVRNGRLDRSWRRQVTTVRYH